MGETVLITGGSSGIGHHLASLFGQEASRLILLGRREGVLREVAARIESQCNVETRVLAMDLTRPGAVEELTCRFSTEDFPVDVLVNCAGLGQWGEFTESDVERQLRMVQLNAAALAELCLRFLPSMLARRMGGILNVASTAGFVPGPRMAVYYATKAFVLSLSEALAEEVRGTSVTITCLAPGPTDTPFLKASGQHHSRLYQWGAMPVESVARAGHQGFRRGRTLVVPGTSNHFSTFGLRFLPRPAARKIVHWLKSPVAPGK